MPYGCFVEIMPGKDGLLHISEIDWKRLETVEEAGIKEGDKIQVKLLEIDPKTGKYKLSHRVLIEKPADYVERPARSERRERPERGERRDRGDRRPDRGDRRNGEHRDRSERGEHRPHHEHRQEEAPKEEQPKDFSDSLDNMDF
jgi:polyribonucleotide nucleotidyltransferase